MDPQEDPEEENIRDGIRRDKFNWDDDDLQLITPGVPEPDPEGVDRARRVE